MADSETEEEKSALALIGEAVYLLRTMSPREITLYYFGTLPFALYMIFFLVEVNRSDFAVRNAITLSLMALVLFVWMKTCQSHALGQVFDRLTGDEPHPISGRSLLSTAVDQAKIQPPGLFLLFLSAGLAFPFGWVYAFYQNRTLFGSPSLRTDEDATKSSIEHAMEWPGQNHLALLFLSLFGLVVYFIIFGSIPLVLFLLKRFTGTQSIITRMAENPVFIQPAYFLTVGCLAYLFLDPLIKSFYLLRCFYSRSRSTGDDLRATLRSLAPGSISRRTTILFLVVLSFFILWEPAGSNEVRSSCRIQTGPHLLADPEELDRSIDRELDDIQYDWRMPRREEESTENPSWLILFLGDVREWLEQIWNDVREFLGGSSVPASGSGGVSVQRIVFVLVILLMAGVVGYLLYALFKNWALSPDEQSVTGKPAEPDLEDEDVNPESLPANRWLEMARENLEKNNYRRAIRAYYLGCLSHLGRQQLLDVKPYKSNGEYGRELQRRTGSDSALTNSFQVMIRRYEQVWYGLHDVSRDDVEEFRTNQRRITSRTGTADD